MSENEPKDWAQYEAQGVPVKEFFVVAVRIFGGSIVNGDWHSAVEVVPFTEGLASIWLEHHPNGPYRESEEASFAKLRAQAEATNWTSRPRFGQTGSVVEAGVPVCGHKSSEDIDGKTHTCTQSKGHEAGGIPHEDETHKWFTRDAKPFLKRA